MSTLYTEDQIADGRRTFHRFMSLNVIAFSVLTGNVISVFAIKLDVSNSYIGLLQSFVHLSMVFVLLGRLLMQYMSSVRVFAIGWTIRYVAASLLLVIPFVVSRSGGTAVATALILIAAGGFHIFRGVGVAGQVAIVAGLASGSDRGRFLSVNSILANTIALVGGLAIAALLGTDAPLSRFVLFFAFAIACGFLSVLQVRKLPEPHVESGGDFRAFVIDVRSVIHERSLRRFLGYLAGFALGTSALIAFLVVLSKRVFLLPDNFTVLLVAIGNMGAVASGLINRKLVDASGAKALIVSYQLVLLVVAVTMIFASGSRAGGWGIMAISFFVAAAAHSGLHVASQAYYFGLYHEQKHRNLGLLYSVVSGSVGAVGAYLGGLLLDLVEPRFDLPIAFRVLFASIALIVAVTVGLSLALAPDRRTPKRSVRRALRIGIRRLFRR